MRKTDAASADAVPFRKSGLIASAVLLFLMSQPALSQSASSVTPQSFQPQLQNLAGAVVFNGNTGTQAPRGRNGSASPWAGWRCRTAFPRWQRPMPHSRLG